MDTLSSITRFSTAFPSLSPTPSPHHKKSVFKRNTPVISLFRATSNSVSNIAEEDVLKVFLRERQLKGDAISKACDMLWWKERLTSVDADVSAIADTPQVKEQIMGTDADADADAGFLKLSATQEWLLGDNSAPINRKLAAKLRQDDRDRRMKLNILQYEALKGELMVLSIGIGVVCSGYCLFVLSVQAAVSYAIGVAFSCLYLQLLYQHADNLSKDMVPPIFTKNKTKKIGIRSEDLSDSFEKSIKGSSMALSSPRLVIPTAIYGLWALCHHYFTNDFLDFQIVPAMFGFLVYKAAALVEVYRENEDLQLILPDSENRSTGLVTEMSNVQPEQRNTSFLQSFSMAELKDIHFTSPSSTFHLTVRRNGVAWIQ